MVLGMLGVKAEAGAVNALAVKALLVNAREPS